MPMRGDKKKAGGKAYEVEAPEDGFSEHLPAERRAPRKAKKAQKKKATAPAKKAASAKRLASAKKTAPKKAPAGVRGKGRPASPRLVDHDGIVYVKGCDIPVWRLEQARRAGSNAEALAHAFPGLSLEAIDLAFSYARRHRTSVDRLIRKYGPAPVTTTDGPDDGAGFEQELGELLDRNAELYRRLAR
jgi:uncharacterized protein (DUF433 family)